MAIYQGTPLPRTRHTGPRPLSTSVGTPRASVTSRVATRPMTQPFPRTMPRAAVPREANVRHGTRLRVAATPRPRTALAGVLVILLVTLVGLFYLSQTFEAAAARYEIDSLLLERQGMLQELQSQQGATVVWGSEATVGLWAERTGLDRLGSRLRVQAP